MLTTKDFHGVARDEYWHCRLLWVASFVLALPVAIAASLTGWRWQPWSAGPGGYKSPLGEANALASHFVALAYSAQ